MTGLGGAGVVVESLGLVPARAQPLVVQVAEVVERVDVPERVSLAIPFQGQFVILFQLNRPGGVQVAQIIGGLAVAVAGGFPVPLDRLDVVGAFHVGEAANAALGPVRDAGAGAVQHSEMKLRGGVLRLGGQPVQPKGPREILPGRLGSEMKHPTHLVRRLHVACGGRGGQRV